MRQLLPLLLALTALTGCSATYQYLTIDSRETKKDARTGFSWENDTLGLRYAFNGYGGQVDLTIYNKSDQPLYVNWKKSAVIRYGRAFSLYNPTANFSASTNSLTYWGGYYLSTYGSVNGSLALPEGMDFIPPHSHIVRVCPDLARTGTLAVAIPDTAQQRSVRQSNGAKIKYRKVSFDDNRSPLHFHSYLTFVLGSDNNREFAEGQSFYATAAIQTGAAWLNEYERRKDQFIFRVPKR